MDIINLELYKTFYVVASMGNISRAAEALYTGQSTISKAIKKLESSLQVKLFTRGAKGVSLTKEGDILFNHISKAINEINNGELAIRKISSGQSGKISIGISATLYKYFMLPHIKSFLRNHSNFAINIVDNSTSYRTLEMIQKEEIDLGILSRPLDLNNIEFYPLSVVEEITIGEPNYIKGFDTSNIITFFDAVTLIFLEKGNITRDYHESYLNKLGVQWRPEIITSNMDFILELVKVGMGIGIVYRDIVKKDLAENRVVELDFLPPIPKREIGIAIKKNKLKSFAVNEFIDYYQKSFDTKLLP